MIYYTTEARKSATKRIDELMKKIATLSGDQLNYIDATETIHYLSMLQDAIINEEKKSQIFKTATKNISRKG